MGEVAGLPWVAGLPAGRPVLVLVGGAAGMADAHFDLVAGVLADLVPVLDGFGAVVVDGGTDAGVMRAMGSARAAAGGDFRLVGVAAEGALGKTPLEPHHTDVVLVPGDRWGDEVPWLADTATAVAAGLPSVTLLANGGLISLDDAESSLARGRPLLVLRGSGRTADAIAARADERTARIADSPLTHVVTADRVAARVARAFTTTGV